jgi:hypothetical protein
MGVSIAGTIVLQQEQNTTTIRRPEEVIMPLTWQVTFHFELVAISHFHDTNKLIDNVIGDEMLNDRLHYCDKLVSKVAISTLSRSLARMNGVFPVWNITQTNHFKTPTESRFINSHNLYHWCEPHDELIISQYPSYD